MTIKEFIETVDAPDHPSAGVLRPGISGQVVSITGRMRGKNVFGKSAFAYIADDSHPRLQLYVLQENIGEAAWDIFANKTKAPPSVNVDTVRVTGTPFFTVTGELSLLVSGWELA